ncbi:FecR family protein [Ancylomarina sp. YFZ004]
MQNNFTDDTYLARWLNNELSDAEVKAFEKTEDYYAYKRIAETSSLLEKPSFDKEKAFQKLLQNRMAARRKPIITFWPYWLAASVAILMGILFLLPSETGYKSLNGEQLAFNLPDGSKVKLNSKSEISFHDKKWDNKRELNLKGEAYFKVIPGSKFKIHTNCGDVSVLGTEFNVHSRNNFFEVLCFEGRVKVDFMGDSIILKGGDAVRFIDEDKESWIFSQQSPSWTKGESTFENLPLKEVVKALERHYKVRFEANGIDLSQRFTGSFTHDDLELALKSVFYPMEIKYKIRRKKPILLYRK